MPDYMEDVEGKTNVPMFLKTQLENKILDSSLSTRVVSDGFHFLQGILTDTA